jgi:carbon monoxide dehydrogenase subunit G
MAMKLTGKHEFSAPPQEVYERLLDPDRLRECMPGCERLDPLGEDRFSLRLVPPVPAIKGEFEGTVQILDKAPPQSFRMRIEATGKAGFVNADAHMRIEANGATSTVHYTADAQVGGPAAAVGQRMLTGISRRQVDQMMRCLEAGRGEKVGLWARIAAWFRSKFSRSDKPAAPKA